MTQTGLNPAGPGGGANCSIATPMGALGRSIAARPKESHHPARGVIAGLVLGLALVGSKTSFAGVHPFHPRQDDRRPRPGMPEPPSQGMEVPGVPEERIDRKDDALEYALDAGMMDGSLPTVSPLKQGLLMAGACRPHFLKPFIPLVCMGSPSPPSGRLSGKAPPESSDATPRSEC